jgi:hypothetical protein
MPDDDKPALGLARSSAEGDAKVVDNKPVTPPPAALPLPASRFGRLIVRYPTFLSSLVVGIAGLVATSMWQYRNYHSQRDQAAAQQKVAETQAANSWKIERAELLGKNLQVLAQTGSDSADQRYGVLLSLTRAEIIDPELAVSYALELGKSNSEYMVSILANTPNKDYPHLLRAYTLSCEERYGTAPAIEACNDKLATRSDALGQLVADEVTIALAGDQPGPLVLLKDERRAQLDLQQLIGLFETAITTRYERRMWEDLDKLAAYSPAAHLIVSIVISASRTGEFVTDDEAAALSQLHTTHTKWLASYLAGKSCDAECKGRMLDVMVTHYLEAQGDFDGVIKTLIESPRAQSGVAISRLHTRLLFCQIDDSDLVPLRDHVLVPAGLDQLKPIASPAIRDTVFSLLALVPDPVPPDENWTELMSELDKMPSVAKTFKQRHALAAKQRITPPPALRKSSFCAAPPAAGSGSGSGSATIPF